MRGRAVTGAALVAIVLCAGLAGCGSGGGDDLGSPRAAVRTFLGKLSHPDGSICDLFTTRYRRLRYHAAEPAASRRCHEKASRARGHGIEVKDLKFLQVDVNGDTAEITTTSSAGPLDLRVVRQGGRWKVDELR